MNKKLTRHGNSLALVIDKPILKLLKINEATILEIAIKDNTLIIRPTKKKKLTTQSNIAEIADQIMDKYEETFKKLSKT